MLFRIGVDGSGWVFWGVGRGLGFLGFWVGFGLVCRTSPRHKQVAF